MFSMRESLLLSFPRAAARAADREAIDEWGIPGAVLMENAARSVAHEARRMMKGGSRVVILAGPGGNGGDGWAASRLLRNAGCDVVVAELKAPAQGSDAAMNRSVALRMGIPTVDDPHSVLRDAELIVDALYGTGLTRAVDDVASRWIEQVNDASIGVLAVDLPTGLDADLGHAIGPTVRATRTVTFLGPKPGFFADGAAAFTGEWIVDDIGMPAAIRLRHGNTVAGKSRDPRDRGRRGESPDS